MSNLFMRQFADLATAMREKLAEKNIKEFVSISLSASGYPLHGDMRVNCIISDSKIGTSAISGDDPFEVLEEYLRRNAFAKAQTGLLLSTTNKEEQAPEPKDPDLPF